MIPASFNESWAGGHRGPPHPGPLPKEREANAWLRRYTCLTALATLVLIGIGGLVTSHNAGMAVPDWPNSYGYNMFLFPVSKWVGGILYEHTHRLWASFVGVLVVGLTRWLVGRRSRMPLAIVGLGEMLAGGIFLLLGGDWKGTGFFLTGIAGVVLMAAAIWARNEPSARPLPLLGWLAFVTVQVQGLLGGLRVVLFKDEIGIFHAMLAQLFFVLLCVIAVLTTRWWREISVRETVETVDWGSTVSGTSLKRDVNDSGLNPASWSLTCVTLLILGQLILGATMRHQHAGLAIPDFPLAYGKIWPAMDSASVEHYNQTRLEATAVNPITGAQIVLQMAHRAVAVLILAGVAVSAWLTRKNFGSKNPLSKMTLGWLVLILGQAVLGAATIWSGKAADVATAHVLLGALSLASGTVITLTAWKSLGAKIVPALGAVRTPAVGAVRAPHPTTSPGIAHANQGVASAQSI
jgi:cytochrome c oxidase assembly protein subunit 15